MLTLQQIFDKSPGRQPMPLKQQLVSLRVTCDSTITDPATWHWAGYASAVPGARVEVTAQGQIEFVDDPGPPDTPGFTLCPPPRLDDRMFLVVWTERIEAGANVKYVDHWEAIECEAVARKRYAELLALDFTYIASMCAVLESTDYEPTGNLLPTARQMAREMGGSNEEQVHG